MTAETKFFKDGYVHRTTLYDDMEEAKGEHRGSLNFSAYRQGHDQQYLGIIGKNYYAKPWGNDSSNVQAVLNGPAYWKRVYYRENIAARFQKEDDKAEKAREMQEAQQGKPMKRSQSDGALQRLPAEDTYADIKSTMKPFVERQGKPRIRAMQHGERLHFFNTLGNKYHMKAGAKNLSWNVSTQTHRSTPTELKWILSNYFRTDTQAVLSGVGSETKLKQ